MPRKTKKNKGIHVDFQQLEIPPTIDQDCFKRFNIRGVLIGARNVDDSKNPARRCRSYKKTKQIILLQYSPPEDY